MPYGKHYTLHYAGGQKHISQSQISGCLLVLELCCPSFSNFSPCLVTRSHTEGAGDNFSLSTVAAESCGPPAPPAPPPVPPAPPGPPPGRKIIEATLRARTPPLNYYDNMLCQVRWLERGTLSKGYMIRGCIDRLMNATEILTVGRWDEMCRCVLTRSLLCLNMSVLMWSTHLNKVVVVE